MAQPGLDEIVKECRGKNLFFSTDVAQGIKDAELIFVSVNTPTKQYGVGKGCAADVMFIELCARSIAEHANSSKIVIEKSTVPARTAETLSTILSHNSKEGISFQVQWRVLSNLMKDSLKSRVSR
jgi:UDPglucose 6-dehydrogenase